LGKTPGDERKRKLTLKNGVRRKKNRRRDGVKASPEKPVGKDQKKEERG